MTKHIETESGAALIEDATIAQIDAETEAQFAAKPAEVEVTEGLREKLRALGHDPDRIINGKTAAQIVAEALQGTNPNADLKDERGVASAAFTAAVKFGRDNKLPIIDVIGGLTIALVGAAQSGGLPAQVLLLGVADLVQRAYGPSGGVRIGVVDDEGAIAEDASQVGNLRTVH
jgi:hypothetical protein